MLQENTIQFLTNLGHNNNKPWFDSNKDAYSAAKEDFESLVSSILRELGQTEPIFLEQKAKDCVFRIFRDVRFSKDKTPYKANFGAAFSRDGRKFTGGGYYLHIEPGGKTFAGGGIWQPEAPVLKKIRQEIDYNFDEFSKIVDATDFKKTFGNVEGERLKTLPAGYTAENPAMEYLKLKSFTVHRGIDDKILTGKKLQSLVVETFNTMRPFISFLNRAVAE